MTDHVALVAHLEQLLHARVHAVNVQRLDLVNETTVVDVRYAITARGLTSAKAGVPTHTGARR
jgi:tRNA (Thr-GGU) A37 N-methylase